MYISKLTIENYRGVKEKRIIQLDKLSSIVGKNDAGKTILLYAVATFLDIKTFSVTFSDFNDIDKPIIFEAEFKDENIIELLKTKLKTKVKKADGLDEYVNDFIFDGVIKYKREAIKVDKKFSAEFVFVEDFKQENIRGLYFKSDDELNTILAEYKIEIPIEGKGRNSKVEKIKFIKLHFKDAERIGFWVEDDCKIENLFPEVEMFKADYGLEADTKFKTASVSEIQDYFEKETSTPGTKLNIVEAEINVEMKKEAQSVTTYMQDYASALKAVQITPVVNWKDAIKSVDVSFQFEGDAKFIPMSHKGTGYRRLFMVARFRYIAEKNKGHNIIYLIEEPETFLHPTAQQDLLNAFKDLSNDNQVIITTHSPVFAGATSVNGVVLCIKDTQSNYENAVGEKDNAFLMKIIFELGIKPSYNLRDNFEKILFVEGQDDASFYKIICEKILGRNLEDKVLVLTCGGSSVDSFINISYFKKNGRDLFLILDSDKGLSVRDPKKPVIQTDTLASFNAEFGKGYLLKKSNIESYYHPTTLKAYYHHLKDKEIEIFGDDQDLKAYFKENGISKKDNIKIYSIMTKEEWNEVVEPELIDFLKSITD
jgi:predicted ATP-dependent endonuclease of OLD family